MFNYKGFGDDSNLDGDISSCGECTYYVFKRIIPEGHELLRQGELGTCIQSRRRLTVYADDPACLKAKPL